MKNAGLQQIMPRLWDEKQSYCFNSRYWPGKVKSQVGMYKAGTGMPDVLEDLCLGLFAS